jgi:beta-glucosidase-like glycosyl hydrolase
MTAHGPGTAPPRSGRSPLRAPPARDRFVADLMAEMTIEEKVGQLTGVVLGPSGAVRPVEGPAPGVVLVGPRPLTTMTRDLAEAQTRIRATARRPVPALAVALHDPTDLPALPPALARAATWDADLVAELASATAGPLAASGIHATAGLSAAPALDRAGWADVASSLGSDPVLAAELVRAHVYGLQGGPVVRPGSGTLAAAVPDVGATAGQAVRGIDHGWSERRMRTAVLPAVESAVRAGAALVLPAAAANDGVPLHADSRLLQQVLRAEWGFTGVVLASAEDVLGLAGRHHVAETADAALALAIESGVHVVFGPDGADGPGCADDMARRMLRLLVEGRLASWLVDAAVVTVLQLKLALGLFDEPVPMRPPLLRPARAALAARAAAQSAVLLTDPRAVLPLTGADPILVVAGGPTVETRELVDALARSHPAGARAADPAEVHRQQAAAVVVVVDDPEGAEVTIGRLVATGTPCVALVGGADPRVLSPLVATTAAVVLCWQPVHIHAGAHAEVLLGIAEPGGRLPVPITGDGGRVVFPLGHGTGYTSVEYSHLRIAPDRGPGPPQLVVQCRVTNVGDRAGKEVVQVYLRDEVASVARSGASLAAFTTVELEPGRTVTVTLRIPAARLAVWNRAMRHVVEPGTFTVSVGRSAADLRLRGTVVVESAADLTD